MAAKLEVDLDLDTKNATANAKKNLSKAGTESGKIFSVNFATALKVAGTLAAIRLVSNAIGSIKDNIKASVSAAQQLEVFETQFRTILGSAKAAQKQLQDLQNFAATTPFQLPGLAIATRQLLSFGVAQEDIIPTLRQVGELAAGVGVSIDDLTIPYGRLISTQKLTLIELDKFADKGVNLYGKLSEQTGRSLKTIRDDISKGKIDFEEFTKALNDLTSEGGTFFGATISQSKTLSGLFSTVSDNLFNLRGAVGKALLPIIKGISIDLIGALNKATKTFIENSAIITNSIFDIARSATFLIKPFRIAFNFISAGFNALKTGIAVVFVGLAEIVRSALVVPLQQFSKLPGEIGEKARSALQNVTLFADAAQNVLKESAEQTKASLIGLFDTGEVDAQLRNAIARYRELGLTGAQAFGEILKSVKSSGGEIAKESNNIAKSLNNALGNAVANSVKQFAQSLADGESFAKAFSSNVIGLVADFAIQAGGMFIALGVAEASIFTGNPAGLITAGAILVGLGTLAKAVFSGGTSGNAGSAGGVGPSSAPLATQPEFVASEPEEREEAQTRVQVTINGDVFDSEETGLRISRILENSSLNENVKIFGGIA